MFLKLIKTNPYLGLSMLNRGGLRIPAGKTI